jgi:hypothetical protein
MLSKKTTRMYREECGAYNNSRKIGKVCVYCALEFTAENARVGAWLHPEDGSGKTTTVSKLVKTNKSLKTQKPEIDRVIDVECNGRIACHNCHYAEETHPMLTRQLDRYRALVEKSYRWGAF